MSIVGADRFLSIATKLSEMSSANDCGSGPRPRSREVVRSDGPSPYRVLLFGGGPAVGYGVLSHDLALAGNLARGLTEATGCGIDMDVVTHLDLRCREMPELLADIDLRQYDLVVVSVGIQDVLDVAPVSKWSAAVTHLFDFLEAGTGGVVPISIIAVPAVSSVLHLEPVLARLADHRAATFNELLHESCANQPNHTFVPFNHDGEAVPCRERALATYRGWAAPMVELIAPTFHLGHRAHPGRREQDRQAALTRLQLDTDTDEIFNRITRHARSLLKTLGAGVSVIDNDRQWFKSTAGASVPMIARSDAMCDQTIQTNHGLVVEDATLDPRFADSYFVTTAKLRSYAGVPLRDPTGHMIGALCVYDNKPRHFTTADMITLRSLAHLIEMHFPAAA